MTPEEIVNACLSAGGDVCPCAKAYSLLDDLDLGPNLNSRREGPHLGFEEGAYPGDNSRGSRQAAGSHCRFCRRLIDLNLPMKVEEGSNR